MVGISHQYKIRIKKSKEQTQSIFGEYWKNVDLNLKKAQVKKVSREEATKIILEYEWLGTMSTTSHHYGIFFDNICGGVICLGVNCTANPNGPKEFGIKASEFWTLARGACVHWTPKGSASKLIAQGLKLLKDEVPECKVVIAYSDVSAGEIGTVYQASNWLYIGYGTGYTRNFVHKLLNRKFDQRMVHNMKSVYHCTWAEVRQKLLDAGWQEEIKPLKHRYIFPLGSKKEKKIILERIKDKILPYPKRSGNPCGVGFEEETSGFHSEEPGSSPGLRSN